MILNKQEKIRYSRQLMGFGFSLEKQQALKDSTVLVAGVGGLGGTVALYLAAAGVGRLVIVHAGELELPDMNRQVLMSSEFIGLDRVMMAQNRLTQINQEIEVTPINEWITEDNVDNLLEDVDIVIDCRHNFEERNLLNKASVLHNKIMVEGAMDDMFGYLTTIAPGVTPCLSCLFSEYPSWDHLGFAVIGVVPGVLGNLMALEAIKVITGIGLPLYSTLLVFDGISSDFTKVNLKRDSECPVCSGI